MTVEVHVDLALAIQAALAQEIKRLPKWKFERDRISHWVLDPMRTAWSFFGPADANPFLMAHVTPVYASGWDGVGSALIARGIAPGHDEYGPLHVQGIARKMVDDLLANPKFYTSTGTPIDDGTQTETGIKGHHQGQG